MGISSLSTYRLKFAEIARFVDFKPQRKMTKGDKAKITRYHSRIGKALSKGYTPVKTRNDGRIAKAHAAQGIRGMPALRLVLAKPNGKGYRTTIGKDGSIRSTNTKGGEKKVTIGAEFFDAEDDEATDKAEIESARLIKAAKKALGHRPHRCTVAFWGGENAWAPLTTLTELLVVVFAKYTQDRGFPADAVTFYWIKRTKNVLKVQQRLRDEKTLAAQKRAQKRKKSDV